MAYVCDPDKTGIREKNALLWYRNRIQNLNSGSPPRQFPKIGDMLLYEYNAKWANELPYWDAHPLSILLEMKPDGFLGLNLHYLPPIYRAVLFNKLIENFGRKRKEQFKLDISYNSLKKRESDREIRYYKPCMKRYLTHHIYRNIMIIPETEWIIALYLPLQKFMKKSQEHVWKESKRMAES